MVNRFTMIPAAYKEGKLLSQVPNSDIGDFTVVRNSIGTRVNKDGFIEVMRPNVPRLDYLDGGCPKLLTEMQSQNFIEDSQSSLFIDYNSTISTTDNSGISPDGSNNAIEISADSGNVIDSYASAGANSITTFSVFLKGGTNNFIELTLSTTGSIANAEVDLNLGAITDTSGGQYLDSSIVDYGNGWYRCSVTYTSAEVSPRCRITALGDGTFKVFGVQLELGEKPSSYIPTNGSVVTRQADQITNAGDSSTFNSQSGVLFVDIKANSISSGVSKITMSNGSANRCVIQVNNSDSYNFFTAQSGVGFLFSLPNLSYNTSIQNKVGYAYSDNSHRIYINGLQVNTDESGATMPPNAFNIINLSNAQRNADIFQGKTKSVQHYDYLSDLEMEQLTGYKSYAQMTSQFNFKVL